MEITIEQIKAAQEDGQTVFIIINGEYYELKKEDKEQ